MMMVQQLWIQLGMQLAILLLLVRPISSARGVEDTVFRPGTIPLDDAGNEVDAHEGWILQVEDTFLWYGTSRKHNATSASGQSDWLSDRVLLFTSHDLSAWRYKAAVFSAAALPPAWVEQKARANTQGPFRLERPKVLYNSARRYYVLIFHLGNIDGSLAEVGFAVSVSPYGPFSFDHSSKPDGLSSSHLTVAVGDGGDTYLARSVPGLGVSVSKLAGDYLDTTGVCSSLPVPPALDTVPALFRHAGNWHLLLSRISKRKGRWQPGPTDLYVSNSSSLCGAGSGWTRLSRPAAGPGASTTFDSQLSFVLSFTFPGTSQVLLIYFADRWNLSGPGSVGNASYVWLPLLPDPGSSGLKLVDPPEQQWRLGDYRSSPSLSSNGLAVT